MNMESDIDLMLSTKWASSIKQSALPGTDPSAEQRSQVRTFNYALCVDAGRWIHRQLCEKTPQRRITEQNQDTKALQACIHAEAYL